MKCPKCKKEETKVLEKRNSSDLESIRRRRECLDCGYRFTTYEKQVDLPLVVIKKDGTKEPFLKEKLASGIQKAVEKRPIDALEIDSLTEEIVEELQVKSDAGEVRSSTIGDLVIEKLKSIDEVAYMRFASVYKEFNDINNFEEELKKLKTSN